MVLKIPPPPPIANQDPAFNRWLLELTSILNNAGAIQATAVTQPVGDNSTKIATDAFVLANTASTPSTAVPLMDATPGQVGVAGTFARGDHVHPTDTSRAPLASPTFTGTPEAPTATALTNDTQIATTAYADSAVGVETARAEAAEALLAPLASPGLTGVPTAPTAANGTNTTQLATTQFVQSAVAGGGGSAPVVKAAVYFKIVAGVVTILKSFNVTSVTRSSTGLYVIAFTTALADALYYVHATPDSWAVANGWGMVNSGAAGTANKTTTQCEIACLANNSTVVDPGAMYATFLE